MKQDCHDGDMSRLPKFPSQLVSYSVESTFRCFTVRPSVTNVPDSLSSNHHSGGSVNPNHVEAAALDKSQVLAQM